MPRHRTHLVVHVEALLDVLLVELDRRHGRQLLVGLRFVDVLPGERGRRDSQANADHRKDLGHLLIDLGPDGGRVLGGGHQIA